MDKKEKIAQQNRWQKEKLDRIVITAPKGTGDLWTEIAAFKGMSRNEFVKACVQAEIDRIKG